MSEKYPYFDESSPEFAAALKMCEGANKIVEEDIKSWDDLYSIFGEYAKRFVDLPCHDTAYPAVCVLYSFTLALKELPEEGDVLAIARRMNEIIFLHPEKTGLCITQGPTPEEKLKEAVGLASVLAQVLKATAPAPEEAKESTRVLH